LIKNNPVISISSKAFKNNKVIKINICSKSRRDWYTSFWKFFDWRIWNNKRSYI